MHNGIGGGGPKLPTGEPFLNSAFPDDPREILLDRYELHTKHCKKCKEALYWVKSMKEAATILTSGSAACALLLAVLALKGLGLSKVALLGSLIGMLVFRFAAQKLARWESLFYFRDYEHWKT